MRAAVVLCLIGSLVVCGSAQAAGNCAPDKMEFVPEFTAPNGLDGTYKVLKSASIFKHYDKPLPRRYTADGHVFYVLEREGTRYFVRQTYDLRTIPEEYGESYPADAPEAQAVPWGRHNRKAERARFTPFLEIQTGPLAGLRLKSSDPAACKQS